MSSPPAISVVVPCLDEEAVLPSALGRLRASAGAADQAYEIIVVDDGSTDRSWDIICSAAREDSRIRGLRLSRNFGHQAALTAGLAHARGAEVLLLDVDLQDPPEMLGRMRAKLHEGYDVVYCRRSSRAGEPWLKLAAAALFYRVVRSLSDIDIPPDTGDFRLLSRRAVDALLQLPESYRFLRGMVCWIGFPQAEILYHREPRAAGRPKYTWAKLFRLSLDGLTGFSVRPLRVAGLIGGGLIALSFLLGTRVLLRWAETGGTVRGWTTLMVTVLFIGGVQTFILGIVGEYVGRVFVEAKRRPLYLLRDDTASTPSSIHH